MKETLRDAVETLRDAVETLMIRIDLETHTDIRDARWGVAIRDA